MISLSLFPCSVQKPPPRGLDGKQKGLDAHLVRFQRRDCSEVNGKYQCLLCGAELITVPPRSTQNQVDGWYVYELHERLDIFLVS